MASNVEISSLDSRFSIQDSASTLSSTSARRQTTAVAGSALAASPSFKGASGTYRSANAVAVSALTQPSKSVSGTFASARDASAGRVMSVSVSAFAKTATVVYKPVQLEQEERQARMNKLVRQGFIQSPRTTGK